ncbi:MAG: type II toxin-antitoxin system RelE/ParE family toxin [Myxococcales bacterium]|nr:type II toxin-antitoxin system RelE/ParE family toxin [Myxococcales bacterium]
MVFAEDALIDLERIFQFHLGASDQWALEQLGLIHSAVSVLDEHPHIGRLVPNDRELRELIISVGKTGYVALYQCDEVDHVLRVLGVRHQREAGYHRR